MPCQDLLHCLLHILFELVHFARLLLLHPFHEAVNNTCLLRNKAVKGTVNKCRSAKSASSVCLCSIQNRRPNTNTSRPLLKNTSQFCPSAKLDKLVQSPRALEWTAMHQCVVAYGLHQKNLDNSKLSQRSNKKQSWESGSSQEMRG